MISTVTSPVWLGAPSPGGLALPSALPTKSHLYAPRGVFLNSKCLVAADSGNHRILIWHGVPVDDGAPADIILGHSNFETEGPGLLHLPTGVLVHDNRLLVADAWHHRVLVWNHIPESNNQPPDYAIGQTDLVATEPNQGAEQPSASSLYWPYGFGFAGGRFWIADTGNRRILGWPSIPGPNEPANIVLGQPSPTERLENRGGAVSSRSFRWPHDIAGDDQHLFVADAGNHRILGWSNIPGDDADATVFLGQKSPQENFEIPHVAQGPSRLRFPYALSLAGSTLAVADTANNRVLLWDRLTLDGCAQPADRVLAQDSFDGGGENRWRQVTHDSLCWPYGICLHNHQLAIADSGNNRVLLWNIDSAARA